MGDGPLQNWFEMRDVRRRWFSKSVWIPLRAAEIVSKSGETGQPGYSEEWFGLGCIAVHLGKRSQAEKLGWMDIGISHDGGPYAFSSGGYKPCEVYQRDEGDDLGISLVIEQHVSGHPNIWHLNQDMVLALGLLNEGDAWVRPQEDYAEVVRQRRGAGGQIVAVEIRSEYLRDYLAARGMALRLSYYRTRRAVFSSAPELTWPAGGVTEEEPHDRFVTHAFEIDEGGGLFGGEVAVFEAWRTDVDPEEDVPAFGPPDGANTGGRSTTFKREGSKFYRVEGELWREEWIEPGVHSERVRGDDPPDSISYLVDPNGGRMRATDLNDEDIGRYLWFDPRVISALSLRRGGGLQWYTRDTGSVRCSPGYETHFGVNRLGLINVYAFDIARRPQWQQRIWGGHNVAPDGAVSAELLKAQMEARPADTIAPEEELPRTMDALDALFRHLVGAPLFRAHHAVEEITRGVHRFRAADRHGLLALAKDVARLTADRIDVGTLRRIAAPPPGQNLGSLKTLQSALGTVVQGAEARAITSPLVGVYELRLGDAHLPSAEVNAALALVGIDGAAVPVEQGRQLLGAVVTSLQRVGDAFAKRGEQARA